MQIDDFGVIGKCVSMTSISRKTLHYQLFSRAHIDESIDVGLCTAKIIDDHGLCVTEIIDAPVVNIDESSFRGLHRSMIF